MPRQAPRLQRPSLETRPNSARRHPLQLMSREFSRGVGWEHIVRRDYRVKDARYSRLARSNGSPRLTRQYRQLLTQLRNRNMCPMYRPFTPQVIISGYEENPAYEHNSTTGYNYSSRCLEKTLRHNSIRFLYPCKSLAQYGLVHVD